MQCIVDMFALKIQIARIQFYYSPFQFYTRRLGLSQQINHFNLTKLCLCNTERTASFRIIHRDRPQQVTFIYSVPKETSASLLVARSSAWSLFVLQSESARISYTTTNNFFFSFCSESSHLEKTSSLTSRYVFTRVKEILPSMG